MVAPSATQQQATVIPLQNWADTHIPDKEMYWYGGYWSQIIFVRDRLSRLFFPDSRQDEDGIRVVGVHRSKSILLPVYSISAPNGLEIRLRCNFYNWVVSVSSLTDVAFSFGKLFDPSQEQQAVYSEGFDPAWVFPPYALSKRQFSLSLYDNYELYTFCWLLMASYDS